MLKYIVRDLTTVVSNLPHGLLAGAIVVLLLSAIIDKIVKKKKPHFSLLAIMGFLMYVVIMLCITFISRLDGDMGMNVDMKGMDLKLFSSWGRNDRNHAYVIENVLLFVPYGFFLACVFKKARKLLPVLVIGMLSSLAIEVIQLVTGTGIFQIDDILTNTLGAIIGYLIFRIIRCFRST